MKKLFSCLVIASVAGFSAIAGGEPMNQEAPLLEPTEANIEETVVVEDAATPSEIPVSAKGNSVGEALMFYIPNRILDALDIFSVSLGVGPTIRLELMASRAIDVGFGLGYQYKLFKDYNRQYGVGTQESYYYSFIFLADESTERKNIAGWVKNYHESFFGIPTLDQPIYDFYQGKRDYWQIGGAMGFLVEGEVYLHPIEWIDLATGVFFYDLRQDDLRASDF